MAAMITITEITDAEGQEWAIPRAEARRSAAQTLIDGGALTAAAAVVIHRDMRWPLVDAAAVVADVAATIAGIGEVMFWYTAPDSAEALALEGLSRMRESARRLIFCGLREEPLLEALRQRGGEVWRMEAGEHPSRARVTAWQQQYWRGGVCCAPTDVFDVDGSIADAWGRGAAACAAAGVATGSEAGLRIRAAALGLSPGHELVEYAIAAAARHAARQ